MLPWAKIILSLLLANTVSSDASYKLPFVYLTLGPERTCFSNDLRWLTRLRGPVRTVTPTNLLPVDHATTAPKEIMRLINWIMSNATNVVCNFMLPKGVKGSQRHRTNCSCMQVHQI